MNINLWFARDMHTNEIVSILDAKQGNKYCCPICNSEAIPKALESKKITPHFAHVDRSKCTGEAMIHWWYKHRFIEAGDSFTIKTDKEIQFACKFFEVEKEYTLSNGTYKPDLVVYTECGNEIIFEMANTNKKKVENYIDQWIELGKIIVEVDIKSLVNNDMVFNALYYQGKCFNFNKRDGGYYNSIGKLKERMLAEGNYDIEKIKQLDWFWKELLDYKMEKIDISQLSSSFDELLHWYDSDTITNIFNKACNTFHADIINFKLNSVYCDLIDYLSGTIYKHNIKNISKTLIKYKNTTKGLISFEGFHPQGKARAVYNGKQSGLKEHFNIMKYHFEELKEVIIEKIILSEKFIEIDKERFNLYK